MTKPKKKTHAKRRKAKRRVRLQSAFERALAESVTKPIVCPTDLVDPYSALPFGRKTR